MEKLSKIIIMLVRLLGLVAIVVGFLLWSGGRMQLAQAHMGIGFLVALFLLVLGVIACVKKIFGLGIVGILFALGLPVIGMMQFPLVFRPDFHGIQAIHVVIAILALGLAEALNGKIQRSA